MKGETGTTILTCDPNKYISPIHNRMPVNFTPEKAGAYLNLPHESACSMCVTLNDSVKMHSEVAEVLIKKTEPLNKKSDTLKEKTGRTSFIILAK